LAAVFSESEYAFAMQARCKPSSHKLHTKHLQSKYGACPMTTILLVEDDSAIAQTIIFSLNQSGFKVVWRDQAHAALSDLSAVKLLPLQQSTDWFVILDVGLPDLSGFEVCRRIRGLSNGLGSVPILFLTAHADEIDRVQGFELGADDYLSKPFSPRELVSRVRAILRRSQQESAQAQVHSVNPAVEPASLQACGIALWPEHARVVVNQIALSLTRTEFKLLEHFMRAPHRVHTREWLLNSVQGPGSPTGDRAVDTHIKTLRAKIQQANPQLDPIKTHRGLGYSFEPH
jgi:two-component system, OmpR family, catabolic regulation response regulator CreB